MGENRLSLPTDPKNIEREDEMRGNSIPLLQKNNIQVVLALVLIAALLIPQLSWAADNPAAALRTCSGLGFSGTVDLAGHEAACGHYADLLELYRTGRLEYHAPGR
jgi:hypothetical protein